MAARHRLALILAVLSTCVFAPAVFAGPGPDVYSVESGQDGAGGRTLTITGRRLSRVVGAAFDEGPALEIAARSSKLLVLRVPAGQEPAPGPHTLVLEDRSGAAASLGIDVGLGWGELPGSPARLDLAAADGGVLRGALGEGSIAAEGAGERLLWYPAKAAFRVGSATDTQWDDAHVGIYSVAAGTDTTASGNASTALGNSTTANGFSATAMGNSTTASGYGATAMGITSVASGYTATALGYDTVASGQFSTSMCLGTAATGDAATALGHRTNARPFASLAIGRYNVVEGSPTAWVPEDPVLVVGNGDDSTPSNALTLLKNGDLTIAGTLTQLSDLRLKRNVASLTGVLPKLAGLRGVSYEFVDATRAPAGRQIGLVAQEVRDAFPELVREDARGTLSVSYQNFTAVLLQAVKEQQALIDAQAKALAAQKATNEALEARLARLEALVGER